MKKINSKQIIDLSVKTKTLKHLEDSVKEKLCDFGLDKSFIDMTPKAQSVKLKKNR